MRKQLTIIFFTVFIDLVGFGMIIPLNTFLARKFGGDELQIGLLMSIYSFMQFIFSPIWGRISDHWGRRPVILISLLGASLAHLGFAFGESFIALLLARAFAGIFGGNISTAMAYIADITESKDRSKGMGLIGAAFGLGFIAGPMLGGIAGHYGQMISHEPPFGMSFAAILASAICFINFCAALFILPETLKRTKDLMTRRPSRFKALFQAFKTPVIGSLMTSFFLANVAMAFMEVSLFMFVDDRFNWNLTKASLGFAYVGFIMVFTQGYLIRKMLPKYGERKLLAVGLMLSGLGITGIAFSYYIPVLAFVITLLGLGIGFVNPSINGSISLLSAKDQQGGTLGINQSLSALGRILGPALGGLFYREFGLQSPFLVGGTCMALALAVVIWKYQQLPEGAIEAGAH
ncbi:MAG: MFS transporter [Bdellovibrionales bacterium]|nr:MFS transporter [Bdellovibrionales bacterium]